MERKKIKLEYLLKGSPGILYSFLTTPSYLIRWFCDGVDITGNTFIFSWDGSEEVAELEEDLENELIRFKWEEAEDEDEFLEFRISISPITGETILEITDFCDEDECEESKQLWESQIESLMKEMGA